MAEIIANEGGGKKKGKKRAKKHSTHIDMTPMVDLACLLLTFFMLTTAFSKPKVMEITLPEKDPKGKQPEVNKSRVLNILLDENDKIYWYNGMVDPYKPIPVLNVTDFGKDGIRKLLILRNKALLTTITKFEEDVTTGKIVLPRDSVMKRLKDFRKADNLGPIVLIKATDKAKYGNLVDIMDELSITNIVRLAVVDINSYERKMIAAAKSGVQLK
jgi:biopolymer transport protein ExbD